MTRVIHAELIRLLRRRTILIAATGSALLATIATLTVFSTARASGAGLCILINSWTGGHRFFPGLVLESLIQGGTVEVGMARAMLTAGFYTGLAAVTALLVVSRRDVTA